VATVTDLFEQNVLLEDVQYLAGHADPRATRIYDRRRRKVTGNLVERISIGFGSHLDGLITGPRPRIPACVTSLPACCQSLAGGRIPQ
jgi:hypothetical protein